MEKLNFKERELAIRHLQWMQYRDKKDIQVNIAMADMGTKDLTFGRLAFSCPQDHYELLKLIYPDLVSRDAKEKTKFITKKMRKEPLCLPYFINKQEQFSCGSM